MPVSRCCGYLICSIQSSVCGWCMARNRWSDVYVYRPTVNKWISRCRTHDTCNIVCKMKERRKSGLEIFFFIRARDLYIGTISIISTAQRKKGSFLYLFNFGFGRIKKGDFSLVCCCCRILNFEVFAKHIVNRCQLWMMATAVTAADAKRSSLKSPAYCCRRNYVRFCVEVFLVCVCCVCTENRHTTPHTHIYLIRSFRMSYIDTTDVYSKLCLCMLKDERARLCGSFETFK